MPMSMPDPERDEDRWYPDLILEDGTQIDLKVYDIDRAHEAADRLRRRNRLIFLSSGLGDDNWFYRRFAKLRQCGRSL